MRLLLGLLLVRTRPRRVARAPSRFENGASGYLYGLELESPIPIESESDSGSDAEVDDELNSSEDGDGSEDDEDIAEAAARLWPKSLNDQC